jgi:hypothetical protein
MSKKIQVGDSVKYARTFLRSIGVCTGDMCFAKGKVTELKPFGGHQLAKIEWDTPEMPGSVLTPNLTKCGSVENV